MTTDPAALIAEARKSHCRVTPPGRPVYCSMCGDAFPCHAIRLADALEAAGKDAARGHYKWRLDALISELLDQRCDAELMDGGWRVRNLDSERLDYILPLLELADGDGNAVATRIGGALLLGLQGRAAIDAARGSDGAE